MNKMIFIVMSIVLYVTSNYAMEESLYIPDVEEEPFIELFSRCNIALASQVQNEAEFYRRLLPCKDTPENRRAMLLILEEAATQKNIVTDKAINSSKAIEVKEALRNTYNFDS